MTAKTLFAHGADLGQKLLARRFVRFLLVGGVNTLFGYSLFYLLLRLSGSAFLALTLSTLLGILFNFITTGSLVFRAMEKRRLVRFFAVYGVVYLYNAAGLAILQAMRVDPALAGLLLLPGAVLLSYALNRSFVFDAQVAQFQSEAQRHPTCKGETHG